MQVYQIIRREKNEQRFYSWWRYITPDNKKVILKDKVVLLSNALKRCFDLYNKKQFYDFIVDNELLLLFEFDKFIGISFNWYTSDKFDYSEHIFKTLPEHLIKTIKRWTKPEALDWDRYNEIRNEASIYLSQYLKKFFIAFTPFLHNPIVTFFPQSSERNAFQPWNQVKENFIKDDVVIPVAINLLSKNIVNKRQIECTSEIESLNNIEGQINLNLEFTEELKDKQLIIIDDICGYGGTFKECLNLTENLSPRAFCLSIAKDKRI